LRERREDIAILAAEFAHRFAAELGRGEMTLSPEAIQILEKHRWPGNVRELRNAIERAVVLARGSVIELNELPQRIARPATIDAARSGAVEPLHEVERKAILDALQSFSQNKTHAARALGISLKTLHNKLKLYARAEPA
jgi:DNA-binding NtrC family response regulator